MRGSDEAPFHQGPVRPETPGPAAREGGAPWRDWAEPTSDELVKSKERCTETVLHLLSVSLFIFFPQSFYRKGRWKRKLPG